jgi:hypothetical protein
MSNDTYTANGHTFTVAQLRAGNPYVEPDGTVKKDCSFKFFAFNQAKQEYELDQLGPEDRAARQAEIDRFREKMGN